MRDYNNNRSRDRGGDRRNSGRPTELHSAVCDECGNNCKVPFKPSSGKPIYCNNCFGKKGGRDGGERPRSNSRRSFSNDSDNGNSQLAGKIDTLNKNLETIILLLKNKSTKPNKVTKKSTKKSAPKKKSKKTRSK